MAPGQPLQKANSSPHFALLSELGITCLLPTILVAQVEQPGRCVSVCSDNDL